MRVNFNAVYNNIKLNVFIRECCFLFFIRSKFQKCFSIQIEKFEHQMENFAYSYAWRTSKNAWKRASNALFFYSNCALQMRYSFIMTAGWNFVTSVTIKTGLACVGNSCKFNKNRLRSGELSNWYNFSRPFNLGEKVLSDCVWSNQIYLPPKVELWAWTKGNEWLVVCGYWWMVD